MNTRSMFLSAALSIVVMGSAQAKVRNDAGALAAAGVLVPLHSSFDRLAPEAVRSGKGCFQAERCSGRGLGKDNSRRSGLGSDQ